MPSTNKIILAIVLIAVLLIGIGYAAIGNLQLNINGTAKAETKQENFLVRFTGETGKSGDGTITAIVEDDTHAKMDVSGLSARGETAVATYVVENKSADLSADLSVVAVNSNEAYFKTTVELGKTSLVAKETTTVTVTVELLKTIIETNQESILKITLTAIPVQPGEEGTGNAGVGTTDPDQIEKITSLGTYLPAGFHEVSPATATEGLTIADSKGNQYVWVEVPKTTEVYPTAGLSITEFTDEEYTKIENDLHTYASAYRGDEDRDEYSGSDESTGLTSAQYTELKRKMLKSVYKNGGFYVGKYETGIDYSDPNAHRTAEGATTQTPVIKQNAYPYNFVTCSQAQTLASNMESGRRTTSLMFGVQWDLVLKYLETKNVATQDELNANSSNLGNYEWNIWNITSESAKYSDDYGLTYRAAPYQKTTGGEILLTTGASETFGRMGIYDIAGNVLEWTLEDVFWTDIEPCANRGGSFCQDGYYFPASCRSKFEITYADVTTGFRTSLF